VSDRGGRQPKRKVRLARRRHARGHSRHAGDGLAYSRSEQDREHNARQRGQTGCCTQRSGQKVRREERGAQARKRQEKWQGQKESPRKRGESGRETCPAGCPPTPEQAEKRREG